VATTRVEVQPKLLQWACDRSGEQAALRARFPQFNAWMRGETNPTLKQLEDFARAAHVPIGYLFLPTPPVEELPIQDLRTMGSKGLSNPSPALLDTIYLCQRRQDWYRQYAESQFEEPRLFVGSTTVNESSTAVAGEMRKIIDFGVEARRQCRSTTEALKLFVDRVEDVGVLVMVSGVVKNTTNRPLNPNEFRGFALADPVAPLVFVNGADVKPAQMFTLAHELAHIWLGASALSNAGLSGTPFNKVEKWCNEVAAEFLVPISALTTMNPQRNPIANLDVYGNEFKVSKVVILRRLLDGGFIPKSTFDEFYSKLNKAPAATPQGGGDFYNTLPVRASKRFVKALVLSTLEGRTLHRDAFQMLGINSSKTFRSIGERVGALP